MLTRVVARHAETPNLMRYYWGHFHIEGYPK
jgi:hypothetical protein